MIEPRSPTSKYSSQHFIYLHLYIGSKHCCFIQIFQSRKAVKEIQVLIFNTINSNQYNSFILNIVKRFQILLCITNSYIKHRSFAYIQLNDQTVQFSIRFLTV